MRVLGAAILDQHSIWWAVASPLFALSVAPYLLFLRNIWAWAYMYTRPLLGST